MQPYNVQIMFVAYIYSLLKSLHMREIAIGDWFCTPVCCFARISLGLLMEDQPTRSLQSSILASQKQVRELTIISHLCSSFCLEKKT
jgi:hypothetical protein